MILFITIFVTYSSIFHLCPLHIYDHHHHYHFPHQL